MVSSESGIRLDELVRERDGAAMQVHLSEIELAARRLSGIAIRTPLLQLHGTDDIWIKPEVFQPVGSFKVRGAYNVLALMGEAGDLTEACTLSAGNMSQAVAWSAHRLGLRSTAIMPEGAPQSKIDATRTYGAEIEFIPRDQMFVAMQDGRFNDRPGFVHPFADPRVAAGNGTVGLEIIDDLPDVQTVIVPVGGGGLLLGVATAIKAMRPDVRVFGVQPDTCGALAASLEAGEPVTVPCNSFVDGAGSPVVFPDTFPALQRLVDGCLLVSDDETRAAIYRLVTRNKVVPEPAGAMAVAAALSLPEAERGTTVCIVSGGSINPALLAEVLSSDGGVSRDLR
jgi:threonine dehydratase